MRSMQLRGWLQEHRRVLSMILASWWTGETHNQSQSRLRIQKNKLCDFIKEHEEEKKVKKQKRALDHQKSLFDASHNVSGALYEATGCGTVEEVESEQAKLKEDYQKKHKILSQYKKELKQIEKDEEKAKPICEFCNKVIKNSGCKCKGSKEAAAKKKKEEEAA